MFLYLFIFYLCSLYMYMCIVQKALFKSIQLRKFILAWLIFYETTPFFFILGHILLLDVWNYVYYWFHSLVGCKVLHMGHYISGKPLWSAADHICMCMTVSEWQIAKVKFTWTWTCRWWANRAGLYCVDFSSKVLQDDRDFWFACIFACVWLCSFWIYFFSN